MQTEFHGTSGEINVLRIKQVGDGTINNIGLNEGQIKALHDYIHKNYKHLVGVDLVQTTLKDYEILETHGSVMLARKKVQTDGT